MRPLVSAIPAQLPRPGVDRCRTGHRRCAVNILRWVVRYTEEFVRRWEPYELTVGRSWLADEMYIKVNGGVYLNVRSTKRDGPWLRILAGNATAPLRAPSSVER